MRHLCRFIIIIFMFFISLAANAFESQSVISFSKHTDTISAIQYNDYDILYSKNSVSVIKNVERQDSISIKNKESDNFSDGGLNNFLLSHSSQFSELLAYIYNQSFLHNKSKVHFSVILSEIQPNAP